MSNVGVALGLKLLFVGLAVSGFATLWLAVLADTGASLIVTTYQSGRVVLVRAEDAQKLNTHLRLFESPMGVAASSHSIAIGTRNDVRFFWNLLESAPAAEAAAGHEGEANVDVLSLSERVADVLNPDTAEEAEAFRPIYIDYLVEHEEG